ncbi:MAG TPA: DUF2071 domain-containing protein [Chthoniobacterales bacterium]
MLINFRADPEVVRRIVPSPFSPKLRDGWSIVGICLIRLEGIRPVGFPRFGGLSSENAAHRIAVTWMDESGEREGVFIPRRDTNGRLNHLAGGRLFPGKHHLSDFSVMDDQETISISIRSGDALMTVDFAGVLTDRFPSNSIFPSLEDSSDFFASGSIGYSVTNDCCRFDGIRLNTQKWEVSPVRVSKIESSFFGDTDRFPLGSIEFDHALIMRDIPHRWISEPEILTKEIG